MQYKSFTNTNSMRFYTLLQGAGGLVAQRLSGFQRERDAFLGFLFAAEGDEGLALEIENILLADQLCRGERTTGKNAGELARHNRVVFGCVAAAHQHVNGELGTSQELFSENFDLRGLRAFLP